MAKKKTITKKGKASAPKKNSTLKKKVNVAASPTKKSALVKKATPRKLARTAPKKGVSKGKKPVAKKITAKKTVAKKGASKPVTTAKTKKVATKKPVSSKKKVTKVAKKATRSIPKKGKSPKTSVRPTTQKKLTKTKSKPAQPVKTVAKKTAIQPKTTAKPVLKKVAVPIGMKVAPKKPEPPVLVPKKSEPLVPKEPKKPLKQKVQIEFNLRSTPTALYELISTPSGFAEWYCVDVDVNDDQYVFKWEDGEEEAATLIGRRLGEVIRFHRNDDEDPDSFFEFRIRIDDMTNDVALIVTDHAWPREIASVRNLWNTQIHELQRVLGA